ncbi:pentatricopeptide repeat-containing protein At4g19220, mitochondrial-like [Phragmites australis]|uniref:pentatricopeptide repeat-containing protein At4g19220, mitochondrial-like n=1 Tax=Phragmites australis TaxID=29695 RepID=UPI002D781291|nr:pentatricopeptide repeat-containing protein At4g19220, mitochondrial-like [Phragmites australis]XP_062208034.1 pentatricopeptide repeat-containing protein At4g19220, mitochondrial-like [Phragmites australis]
MLRQTASLLATTRPILPATSKFLRTSSPPLLLGAIASSHHAAADAHHLLDERPSGSAGAIVRALTVSSFGGTLPGASVVASLHCASLKSGSVLDPPVRTSVLTAYARARDAGAALALFDEAVAPDVILWNATINALTLNRRYDDAVAVFGQMARVLGAFDSTTVVVMLSGASRAGNLGHGMAVHAMVMKRCLDADHLSLWNALVDMYAKCGDFDSAEGAFQGMPCRDTASWNSVISGSIFNGLAEVSACYFKEMTRSIFQADEWTLSSALSACCRLDDLFSFGESVHSCVVKLGYEDTTSCSVANSLTTFYSEFGLPEAAEKVFASTSNKNLVSWNAMIKGLVENGRVSEALVVFREMRAENRPDVATLVTVISACGDQGLLSEGKAIHGYIIRKILLHEEPSLGNSLLGLYLECDNPSTAGLLFRTMPIRDLISWNTMISGYSRNSLLREEARSLFKELLSEGLSCSLTTMLAVIPSCSSPEELGFGEALHSFTLKYGLTSGVSAVNALMHMYISCGDSLAAFSLMERMILVSDIVSWNTIIAGCVHNGLYKDALEAFQFMHSSQAINPDSITLVSILSACGNLNLQSLGKSIHCITLKHLLASNLRVRNALLAMYFGLGDTRSAELVFHSMGNKNLCSWNCMISGFTQNNKGWSALQFYQKMEDFAPNEISIVGIICACTQLGNYRQGKSIHGHVVRSGLKINAFISASLVDMYCKCGRLDIAVRVFEASAEKSIAGWNSMISAFGFHGHGLKSVELFWKMNDSGTKATKSTFIALLSACSHSGLVDEGWKYYHIMSEKFGIIPTPEHHVCIVDMLGRAGRLQEAHKFVDSLPSQQAHGVWGALLSACSSKTELKMGESIAKHLLCLEPENSGYYVTISNLYAHRDMWSGAVQVRSILQDKGLIKPHGHSIVG